MTFLTSTLFSRADENVTWDQGKKHIYDLSGWSFPTAIMRILGLQSQKLEKGNTEERCRGGEHPAVVSRMDMLTCL